MKVKYVIKEGNSTHYMRLFLLFFLFHFFVIQPIINSFHPEMALRVLTVQNIEENEEEEDLAQNRIVEEELLNTKHGFSWFIEFEQLITKFDFSGFNSLLYACAKEEVNTPPPEA